MHTSTYIHRNTHTHTHTNTHTHTYTHTYIHAHTHIHTCTYTHTHIRVLVLTQSHSFTRTYSLTHWKWPLSKELELKLFRSLTFQLVDMLCRLSESKNVWTDCRMGEFVSMLVCYVSKLCRSFCLQRVCRCYAAVTRAITLLLMLLLRNNMKCNP